MLTARKGLRMQTLPGCGAEISDRIAEGLAVSEVL
jgi:hypothetical protein